MASPQAQDIAPKMRPTKSGTAGKGTAGRPFGRTRKKAGTARKPSRRKAGARKGAGGRARGGRRAAKKR
jgi:hypothetical protein